MGSIVPHGKDGQDSRMTDQEMSEKVEALKKEREANQDKWIEEMEKDPRCAILPSPEKLDESICSPGSDETDTLGDFDRIRKWLKQSGLRNIEWYCDIEENAAKKKWENLENSQYYPFVRMALSTAFDAMRFTKSPDLYELVFWYYAGHGLGKEAAAQLSYSSTPCLDRVQMTPEYHKAADQFVKEFEGRKVKGGELCLHKVGFCDLYGLLKPWIAAVKAPSTNAEGRKKNKNLAIILDSCYSGIIAQELRDFKDQMETKSQDPSFLKENSVTIQAACGSDEVALGGYFTPCFVYLNDPNNAKLLSELKADWMGMKDEERNQYKALQLPSPMVVTTIPDQDGTITMELTIQGFKLTLFQDPGFFKFCSVKVYQYQDKSLFNGKDRVLNHNLAKMFMKNRPFEVLDYKLKTYQGHGPTDPYANTSMGLFLLKDHQNVGRTVCAHIHFKAAATTAQRINLVHHKIPLVGSLVYLHEEDHDGLTHHKAQVPIDGNAQDLVEACRAYVESKEPGRWKDSSRWNMKGIDLGVNRLFRVQEQHHQRSAWEGDYLEHIKKFDIPVVADN